MDRQHRVKKKLRPHHFINYARHEPCLSCSVQADQQPAGGRRRLLRKPDGVFRSCFPSRPTRSPLHTHTHTLRAAWQHARSPPFPPPHDATHTRRLHRSPSLTAENAGSADEDVQRVWRADVLAAGDLWSARLDCTGALLRSTWAPALAASSNNSTAECCVCVCARARGDRWVMCSLYLRSPLLLSLFSFSHAPRPPPLMMNRLS